VPELFLQVQGHTRLRFPQGGLPLAPGLALLLPPRLLHDEQVRPGDAGEPFANLVLQADGAQLGCHLAHAAAPGRPGIAHLERRSDPGAGAMRGCLVAWACGYTSHSDFSAEFCRHHGSTPMAWRAAAAHAA
jgi:hypothetical protein